jgi:hypothetical protein
VYFVAIKMGRRPVTTSGADVVDGLMIYLQGTGVEDRLAECLAAPKADDF